MKELSHRHHSCERGDFSSKMGTSEEAGALEAERGARNGTLRNAHPIVKVSDLPSISFSPPSPPLGSARLGADSALFPIVVSDPFL